jgi:hypothetical protein
LTSAIIISFLFRNLCYILLNDYYAIFLVKQVVIKLRLLLFNLLRL